MPQKKNPKYKVGDVVRYDEIVPQAGIKGILVTVDDEGIERGTDDPYEYLFVWFDEGLILDDVVRPQVEDWEEHDGGEDTGNFIVAYADQLEPCKGIENEGLCNKCAYDDLCNHLQEIVLCDISEFGQLRDEGKQDFTLCQQCKCKHFATCTSNKWLV